MNILCVISGLSQGGAERVMVDTTARWVRNHRISLLTFYPPSADFFALDSRVDRRSLHIGRRRFWNLGEQWRLLAGIRRTAKEIKPNAVVSFVAKTNVYVLAALIGTGIPVFPCEHSIIDRVDIPNYIRYLRRCLYPLARRVGVLTASAKNDLLRACPKLIADRIVVIPNPVIQPPDPHPGDRRAVRKEFNIPEEAFWIVSLGRLHPVKGYDKLIRTAELLAHRPAITISIFGEGQERAALESQLNNSSRRNVLALPGAVTSPARVLAGADLFVSTSEFEGFPMGITEAMAMGLPVVAFNVPGVGDIVRQGLSGLLVPPGDTNALASAILRLIDDGELRTKLSLAAREFVQDYAPDLIDHIWFEKMFGSRH